MTKRNQTIKALLLLSALFGVVALHHAAFATGIPGGVIAVSEYKKREKPRGTKGDLMDTLDVGYKVYAIEGADTVKLVTDERGNVPAAGLLHKVCVGAADTDKSFTVFDSSVTTGNIAVTDASKRLIPRVHADTGKVTCETFDVQFHHGLVGVLSKASSCEGWIYWRPFDGSH